MKYNEKLTEDVVNTDLRGLYNYFLGILEEYEDKTADDMRDKMRFGSKVRFCIYDLFELEETGKCPRIKITGSRVCIRDPDDDQEYIYTLRAFRDEIEERTIEMRKEVFLNMGLSESISPHDTELPDIEEEIKPLI